MSSGATLPNRVDRGRPRPARGGVVAACALLSGILLLGGCNESATDAEPTTEQTSSSADASTQTTPAVVKPKAYQRELDAATEDLRIALAAAESAKDIPALAERLDRAAKAASAGAEQLRSLNLGEDADAEHRAFVSALDQLNADLGAIRSAVRDKQLCAPSSALADLGDTKAYTKLPQAISGLAAKGHQVRLGDLETPPKQNRRLANGTLIRRPRGDAHGTLEVDNGGGTDAVITLASGGDTALSVYVRKGQTVSSEGIPDGNYTAFFSTGDDWDGDSGAFTRNCLFQKFDDPVRFETTATTYSINSLTLHQVMGGNATTSQVDPGDFPSP